MIKHIDDGAFASVFQVIHKPTKKVYALKMAKAKHKETYVEKQLEQ